jgi:hypothetical protein
MVPRLESLPTEILLELFGYFPLSELYYGFFKLNTRFRRLIQSILHLSVSVYKNDTELQTLFADRITRMVIGQYIDVIDFRPYPNLRSLVIHGAGQKQLEQIKSDLVPNLVHLSISSAGSSPAFIELVTETFSGLFVFLRRVEFSCSNVLYDRTWLTSTSLRSVSLHCSDPFLIPVILTSCPHLSCLQVRVTKIRSSVAVLSNLKSHPLKTLALVIEHDRMPSDTIDRLLVHTPNIKSLSLHYFSTEPLARLARSLSSHVQQLRQFHCNITEPMSDNTIVTEDSIRMLHPCFHQIQITTKNYVYRVYITQDYI